MLINGVERKIDPGAGANLAALPGKQEPKAPHEWPIGTRVSKISGSQWHGCVCGFYSTKLTPEGYCVESERESGSVQNYPRAALTKARLSRRRNYQTARAV